MSTTTTEGDNTPNPGSPANDNSDGHQHFSDVENSESAPMDVKDENSNDAHGSTLDMADAEGKEDSDDVGNSLQKEEGTKQEKRERRKAKSKYNNMDNEDLEKMLKWKHGIGHLPGSNLKFRKSDTGTLEVITPISDDEDILGESRDLAFEKKPGKRKRSIIKGNKRSDVRSSPLDKSLLQVAQVSQVSPKMKKEEGSPDDKKKRKDRKKLKFPDDDLLKCETCGCYGLISEFKSSGRFCSQRCICAFATKRKSELIAEHLAAIEKPAPKQPKKSGKKRKGDVKDLSSPFRTRSPSVDSLAEESKVFFPDDAKLYYEAVGHEEEFDWENYMKITGSKASSLKSFIKEYSEQELFPRNGGQFRPKMKLECIDPRHQSCICVATIIDVQGARIRLHFDGWSENYDFWMNVNSPFLFPCGWSEKNCQKLNPARGMNVETFHWSKYLHDTGCEAAPSYLFREIPKTNLKFTINMKLEAVDRKNPDLICVASVNNVIGEHFLIHFDEWDDQYDYWCREDGPFIHEVGWCSQLGIPLVPPTDEMVNNFVWEDYLKDTNCIAAPKHIFQPRPEPTFEVASKLEVVDPRNSSLLRVATVCDVEQHQVKVHFDGWDVMYDYWFDSDSPDLHPANWSKKTGHTLEVPPSGKETVVCGTMGCNGVGHIKGVKYTTHHTSLNCPYTMQNVNRTNAPVIDRLAPNALAEESSVVNRIHNMKNGSPIEGLPDSCNKSKMKKRKYRRREDTPSTGTSSIVKENFTKSTNKPVNPTRIPANQNNQHPASGKAVPWTQDDVVKFLNDIGCGEFSFSFKENQIDGQALLLLSQTDLIRHLKLKMGPALKIYNEISRL